MKQGKDPLASVWSSYYAKETTKTNENGEEGKQIILNLLRFQGKIRTPELAAKLDVSTESVRRYLEELESENKLKRVYGGAVKMTFDREEPSKFKRKVLRMDEKRRIGRAAAELVQDKDVIILDDGTTTLQLIEFLLGKSGITVIVVSVPALTLLIDYKNKGMCDGDIVFVGGRINATHYRTSGSLARHFSETFHADKAFLVADGIHADLGVTSYDDNRGLLSRAFMRQSSQTIVLADHSKIGENRFCKIADWSEVDIIISDVMPPPEWEMKLEGTEWIAATELAKTERSQVPSTLPNPRKVQVEVRTKSPRS
ncbi:DeoR/GlpR family DNA-binding transcription regulator [Paenibacillus soyae]|uniref:DeoR/GlpR family DNA-binding transcription regulator n=1 Tax=Paenibacillus soyae TaxID=2969249 RepID=A0A9X2MKJ8_9BACL|nr:DeoR/GlpR family DNA-binding transcription regulator [Paenibacillus soyae]MCR2802314.1 DeoR/GlpR family DNA-binding transcription regulator [Paenibacillus soyae]